ncbi:hypothetical protein M770_34890 (plasmid) [Pseudomonas aeruginosa VRFPA03]|nr:hypothetical protein M770_34890 [Pseudomonas aeruginosa VRFPA03]
MPGNATPSASHKYLIETNPALTELKQFLNSDYLLSGLGMNPDDSRKRLGDGLYEQRLIRDAVVARTGQRYIDGLSSDEALFRYLMDNAIAYKDSLQLQLGVGLSAEQMAALTHDIVWLEEVEVNGEKVLVPVVYLAQAEGRLAPNGALIQGRDVKLVSGGDLHNVGTLRARNDLSATADNLDNSGLIEAGKRLDLLAGDSIRNRQGGVIAGRDVNLTALTGDVINERSVTRYDSAIDGRTWERSFADSAARVEAANSLNVQAGRDIANLGGVLQSRGDLTSTPDATSPSPPSTCPNSRNHHCRHPPPQQFPHLSKYDRAAGMPGDLPAIPVMLWNWGLASLTGRLRTAPEELVWINLLPHESATVSELGIRLFGCFYSCPEAIREGWFHRGQGRRPTGVTVAYDPRSADHIYLRPSNSLKDYWVCDLADRSRRFRGMTFWDVWILSREERRSDVNAASKAWRKEASFWSRSSRLLPRQRTPVRSKLALARKIWAPRSARTSSRKSARSA